MCNSWKRVTFPSQKVLKAIGYRAIAGAGPRACDRSRDGDGDEHVRAGQAREGRAGCLRGRAAGAREGRDALGDEDLFRLKWHGLYEHPVPRAGRGPGLDHRGAWPRGDRLHDPPVRADPLDHAGRGARDRPAPARRRPHDHGRLRRRHRNVIGCTLAGIAHEQRSRRTARAASTCASAAACRPPRGSRAGSTCSSHPRRCRTSSSR
jgi:hypothetical protein